VRASELRQVTPLVRVTTNEPHIILRFLDTGVQGIQVPMINSAEEAIKAVRAAKFSPFGIRGLAGSRAADYGQTVPFNEYVLQANSNTLLAVQIETSEAVDRVSEIAVIEGVDVVFVGTTDLCLSLGLPAQPKHPRVCQVIDTIAKEVMRAGKILGAFVASADSAREWQQRGARYLVSNLESILVPAMRQFLEKVRG
jgi:4-hydroxy-2-oxoheptanedioate aldolase